MFVPYVQNKPSPGFFNGLAFSQNVGALKKKIKKNKKIRRYLTHFKYSFSSFF